MSLGAAGRAPEANAPALREISGFYPTPGTVIELMLQLLGPLSREDRLLEPSAGRGDIADRIAPLVGEMVLVEPHPVLAEVLRAKGYAPVRLPFEAYTPAAAFSKVAMNPPFRGGLDMSHVRRAFAMLAPGGALAALMNDGEAPEDGTPEQRAEFGAWLATEPTVVDVCEAPLDPALFLGPAVFRPSCTPMKVLSLRKRR